MNPDPELLEKARKLAPKMDENSLRIFASSELMQMISIPGDPHRQVRHEDCTGFYQRKRK